MELRQIQYFTVIVREGSFSRAALKLHIGQPALSKQIKALERELGVDLLVRLPEGVRPTPAGSRLDELAATLLGYVDDIGPAVREAAAAPAGTVRLGLSPSLVPALAGHLEQRFAAGFPHTKLEIVEALPMFLADWLAEDRLYLGVFTLSSYATRQLSLVDVGSDEMLLAGTPAALAGIGEHATPDAVRSRRLALTPGFRELLAGRPEFASLARQGGSGIDSLHLVRDLVLRGEYCSVLPYTFLRADLESGALSAVGFSPVLERELVAATRAGRRLSPAVRSVVELVRSRLAEFRRPG
ncbi:LysR family transcriptional regulator, nitrogen assimilation regulatory protein [Amycolatopsis sacchari]|uniref:LysR family transcriptional regulator, nitrogen assimilation regulatory protein n=1 Tax=Amycolatopsis sacchari TaxID=115433 RepID=A0A1I3PUE8_9PSEU|nr:LysR family transcriptional regulator [Amycolatopsis sacchari]SFJ25444.1 LysR family transcriptional regulator, nitrogen assimilation regulatory protein [Amycolatopsis sacchari]